MARRSRRSNPSGLPHLLVGLALGLAVAAGVYFSDLRSGAGVPERPARAARQQAPAAPAQPADSGARTESEPARSARTAPASSTTNARSSPSGQRAAADEPEFDFYDILPQYEVLVPEEVETVSRPAPPAAPVAAPGSYVLQTGSFRSHADADRMQASLALLGVESRIQKVAIDAGEFHRVRIGPISSLDELNRIRTVLRQA